MPRELIDNFNDPRLDPYRSLTRQNTTRWTGQFVAEGKLVVRRLVESRFDVVSVLVSDRRESEVAEWLPETVLRLVIPQELAEQLVGFNFHVGLLACGRRRPAQSLERALDGIGPADRSTIVICDRVNDPENLGAIIRIATGFGATLLLLGAGCCDPFSRRVLRVSMGTALRLPIVECVDLSGDLDRLSAAGFELAATVLSDEAEPLSGYVRGPRTAVFFGNEATGLAPELIARCDRRLTIPMAPDADSLNVAVAAGIFLHHLTR